MSNSGGANADVNEGNSGGMDPIFLPVGYTISAIINMISQGRVAEKSRELQELLAARHEKLQWNLSDRTREIQLEVLEKNLSSQQDLQLQLFNKNEGLQKEIQKLNQDGQELLQKIRRLHELEIAEKQQKSQEMRDKTTHENAKELENIRVRANKSINDENINFQKLRRNLDEELQRSLSDYNRETQFLITAYQQKIAWENAQKVADYNKMLSNWPLKSPPSELLSGDPCEVPIPLTVFLAPPKLEFDLQSNQNLQAISATAPNVTSHATFASQLNYATSIPPLELKLSQGVREFQQKYYPLNDPSRPTKLLAGEWESKRFHGESSIEAIFRKLNMIPALILESEYDGEGLNFHIAFWGVGEKKYFYKSLSKLPFLETIYTSVRQRVEKWLQDKEKAVQKGINQELIKQLFPILEYNSVIYTVESRLQDAGLGSHNIQSNYQVEPLDYEELWEFLNIYNCFFFASIADVYFLQYYNVEPKVAEWLPELVSRAAKLTSIPNFDQTIVAAVSEAYKSLYEPLEASHRSYWVPFLKLNLARAFNNGVADSSLIKTNFLGAINKWLYIRGAQELPENGSLPNPETISSIISTRKDKDFAERLFEFTSDQTNDYYCDCNTKLKETLQILESEERILQTEVQELNNFISQGRVWDES